MKKENILKKTSLFNLPLLLIVTIFASASAMQSGIVQNSVTAAIPMLDSAFIAKTLGTTIFIANPQTGITTVVLVRQAPSIVEPNGIVDNKFTLMNVIIEFKIPPGSTTNETVYAMGDFDLLESEVNPVLYKMVSFNWTILNLHPHMKEEQPKLQFLHWQKRGNINTILSQINDVLALTSIGKTDPITPQTALDLRK